MNSETNLKTQSKPSTVHGREEPALEKGRGVETWEPYLLWDQSQSGGTLLAQRDTAGTEKQQEDQTPQQAPQHGGLHRANKNLYHLAWKTNEAYLGKVLKSAGLGSRDFRCQWA